jgi:hypothetical protein
MIMNISELQEPYKTLAKFFMKQVSKKTDLLNDAFHWGSCTGRNYVSHNTFWSKVNKGQKPQVPESIATYYEKKSGKKLPVVMGMPKKQTQKQKAAAKASAKGIKPTVKKVDTSKFIGRKIRSFSFESGTNNVIYDPKMNNFLGHDGTIIDAIPDAVLVSFSRVDGNRQFWYPFSEDIIDSLLKESAVDKLIPQEEVQEILDAMPEDPFIVGQTVYFRGNGGQYKCKVTHANFTGRSPISAWAGKRHSSFCTTVDGRSLPDTHPRLSHTPWLNENGVPLEILNPEPEEQRDYKEELRLAKETIANLDKMCSALREDKEYWFDIADQAHKNEEAMLKELDSNLDRAAFHCSKVAETTGSITVDDVAYCLDLIKRVMHHQFAYKPKQEEV